MRVKDKNNRKAPIRLPISRTGGPMEDRKKEDKRKRCRKKIQHRDEE
jgi:hypothetical protein